MMTNSQTNVYIIAEAGVNHDGQVSKAHKLIDVAAESGADAVKFQTFQTGLLVSQITPLAPYQARSNASKVSQKELLEGLELSHREFRSLRMHADEVNIDFLSSPFDIPSLRFLVQEMDVNRIKLGSGEITNYPLLVEASLSGIPLIVSTGASYLWEIETALMFLLGTYEGQPWSEVLAHSKSRDSVSQQDFSSLRDHVSILHCCSAYPTPEFDLNLRAIATLQRRFNLEIGFSDHSQEEDTGGLAVAAGAAVIEKHITLDRNAAGPDHAASLDPTQFTKYTSLVRRAENIVGTGAKVPMESEHENIDIIRRSLVVAEKIDQGSVINHNQLQCLRPGTGTSTMFYWDIVGSIAQRNYLPGEFI